MRSQSGNGGLARLGRRRLIPVAAAAALCLAVFGSTTSPAFATEPGRHGRIAFNRDDPATGDSHIFVISPDGTGEHELLARTAYFAAWSPSGRRLAVTVFTPDTLRPAIISADGSHFKQLDVPEAPLDLALLCRAWSANAVWLLCQGDSISQTRPESNGVYAIHAADGSHLRRLTTDAFPPVNGPGGSCGGGDWPGGYSPDGKRFVFLRTECGDLPAPDLNQTGALFVANADGTGLRQLTPYGLANSHQEGVASWSPDGRQILFGGANGELFTVRPDGRDLREIPLQTGGSPYFAFAPVWSPNGRQLVFGLFLEAAGDVQIYKARANGHDVVRVTNSVDPVNWPNWGRAADG
jgi:hypothetical protein